MDKLHRVVSTTITGNAEETIGDALKSIADQVDECIVIDTGTTDDTMEAALRAMPERSRGRVLLHVFYFPWRNDFAAARNFALECATEVGADWAITVDTDERMIFDEGFNLRERLTACQAQLLMVQQADESYAKERIFRLPTRLIWRGPVHEALHGINNASMLRGAKFTELEKTEEQLASKFMRDVEALTKYSKEHLDEPRWMYFLGASLHGLKLYEEAIVAYEACVDTTTWPEEGAWSCYAAAQCSYVLKDWQRVISFAARGLTVRPATAELAWLAGLASYYAGRYEDALAWSNMAIANGGTRFSRLSFREQQGLYEGPFQVLYFTHKALGNEAEATLADEHMKRAMQARSAT